MGKAYSQAQRDRVKGLLEAGRDEEWIEKETGVSDRTIRRWKLELERTGRIGKPPESRTGRNRVLTPEVETALFEYVKDKPDMSVDDMLWWLYDTYKLVVGTRTIRRVFERKGDKSGRGRPTGHNDAHDDDDDDDEREDDELGHGDNNPSAQSSGLYPPPYEPIAQQTTGVTEPHLATEQQLASVLQQHVQLQRPALSPRTPQQPPQPVQQQTMQLDLDGDLPDDEESIQLELHRIALQRREVELKLKMRRIKSGQTANNTPASTGKGSAQSPRQGVSSLYNPNAVIPQQPKRDSRSKKKIEESKKRTAERQERMLRDLERRSRRRDHLTAEWVQSKDIWPLRAQGLLADLMHQYGCYAFSQAQTDTFELMYRELYQLVDLQKGDWVAPIHDDMLRERMKRKMGQLRTKMQKTGEIVGRTDSFGGFQKAENYTGEQAGTANLDENELVAEMQNHAEMQQHDMQQHDLQSQPAPPMHDETMHYDAVTDHQSLGNNISYGMMTNQAAQYPIIDQTHAGMMPYGHLSGQMSGQMNGSQGVMGLWEGSTSDKVD